MSILKGEVEMNNIEWYEASENNFGIETIAFEYLGKDIPGYGKIIGYNEILKGDKVIYKNKEYTIVMVSRMGDFGLSETGELPYALRVIPTDVNKVNN